MCQPERPMIPCVTASSKDDLPMPVISFLNPKGGVGKSTSALLLADGLAAAGASVTVIDGDPNQTLFNWAKSATLPGFRCERMQSDDSLVDQIDESAAQSQFVVIDLEGTRSQSMTRAISRSQLLIIPMQASAVDARQAGAAIGIVRAEEKVFGRKFPFRVMFTRVNPAIATRDEKEIRAQFSGLGIPMLETALNDRAAFRAIFSFYTSLWKLDPQEVNGLEKAHANAGNYVREVTQVIRSMQTETIS